MLPVTDKNIIKINLDNPCDKEKKYVKLLKEQIYWLNRNVNKIYKMSRSIYSRYKNNKLENSIFERCCDFMLLEQMCKKYNEI